MYLKIYIIIIYFLEINLLFPNAKLALSTVFGLLGIISDHVYNFWESCYFKDFIIFQEVNSHAKR